MTYSEAGGYSGELLVTYDNFGNMTDLRDSSGSSVKAVLVDPNNASITQYNPQGIDNPFTYRARQGFIGIEMWPGNDTGVYLQGHLVIPNPWGDVFTNGTTTTTTDDTIDKDTEPCGNADGGTGKKSWWDRMVDCLKGKGLHPKLPQGILEWIDAIADCTACCLCIAGSGISNLFMPETAALLATQCGNYCDDCASSFGVDPLEYILEFIDCVIQVTFSKK
jgi:hypothetical protein